MTTPRIVFGRPLKHKPHPTKPTVIKSAKVDRLMVPLVHWLNSFESVTTLYCCQGGPTRYDRHGLPKAETVDAPYCLFSCASALDLTRILAALGQLTEVAVGWSEQIPVLRYTVRFQNQDHLRHVLDGLVELC